MLVNRIIEPNAFVHEPEAMWSALSAVGYVVAGGVGLAGLLLVLILPRDERPKSHRYFTIGMVAVGLAALLVFNLPMLDTPLADLWDDPPIGALLACLVLPFGGGAWLLAKSWRFLFAVAAGRESGES